MRLKKMRLAGFKSFVDPTNIPFPDDMTAIVGPNGCGKSNVIDAVRWVLGESSAKNLRGDAMTDVIFNGSSSRRPVSQCSVELIFDNTSQRIQGEYAAYNEISVKRLVTRDATSTYFLNGAKCRRRDVTDLFLGTGLGPRSYAIIEQGMISRLIESKPQELRVFIEEAAGVSKYKERRRETENRIRHTRDNLDRLGDVRTELGQQLEKLQRQASAAKRYTELKAKERTYKGQLAAIRWLKHGDKIADLEHQVQQKEAEVQAYIAKQRGDEKEITEFKEQLAEIKQQVSDTQHQFYMLGNEITRLEQNKVFRLQRESQLNEEIGAAEAMEGQLEVRLLEAEEKSLQFEEQLEMLEPEEQILSEHLLEMEDSLSKLQDEWATRQQAWRAKDQQFMHLKQQAQARHSKIQGLLQVQLRTEKRITDIKAEINQGLDPTVSTELEETREKQLLIKVELEERIEEQELLIAEKTDIHNQHVLLSGKHTERQKQVNKLESKIESLNQIYQRQFSATVEVEDWLNGQVEPQPFWEYIQVEDTWRYAVETAMQQWRNTWILQGDSTADMPAGLKGFFSDKMTTDKPANTLAQKCFNSKVPHWLTQILTTDNEEDAKQIAMSSGRSVITKQGLWQGNDWMINGLDKSHISPLEQKAEIQQLSRELVTQAGQLQELEQQYQETDGQLEQLQKQLSEVGLDIHSKKLESQHLKQQVQLLENQVNQYKRKQQMLNDELVAQEEQLEEEKLQLEELSIQLEELEMQVEDLQLGQEDIEQQRHQHEEKIESTRRNVEQIKTQQHSMALKLQDLRFQLNANQKSQVAGNTERNRNREKLDKLNAELAELLQPGQGQQEKLETLLAEKEQLTQRQNELTQQQLMVEEQLAESEKGQVGVQQQVEKMRAEMQSLELEIERNRTRANTFVEQLQEMQQSLKHILENLPEEYEEEEWRVELEKTSSALQRLGAVNLAAVEEFEVQSERKKHLDTQNDDLEAAMETLENAIRKIDKETRTRFKETFDKVNDDVKMLFPKVFGGGAAWLELTGEDLLETGVTIMARPPGKKNSTIHLLSGGEKALTALSLVFAIFRLNPAPFCLLDEVDAPLDDANVGRFCKLVSEMSKTVQFIFISHNKIAMEMAYHLTGVTMAEPGVSRIVAVDVEEAVAIANA